jgi:hypothetical protein
LLIILFASVVGWSLLSGFQWTPQRIKGVDHPPIYPSELLLIVGPPVLAAVVLGAMRCTVSSGQTVVAEQSRDDA